MLAAGPADDRIEAAKRLRPVEERAASLAENMSALEEKRLAAERRLAEHAAALSKLLPLAERLALYPAETVLAAPGKPEDAIRGLLVLRGLSRQLETEAEQLRAEAAAAAAAEREIASALPELRAQQAQQALGAAQLDRMVAADAARPRTEDPAAERRAAQAGRAETLRDAVLAAGGARAPTPRAATAAMLVPVAGPVVRRWGEPTDAGPASGLTLRAPPLGRVVAPCAGRIAFAGPFRSFGKLIILECEPGTDIVLAGLDRLDVQVAQPVGEGEPLGVMPNWDPAAPPPHPALYVEIRREGQPVDPTPFLRARS